MDNSNYTRGVSRDCAPSSFALSGKVMLSSVVILFTLVAVIVFLHSYARWLLRRHRTRRRRIRTSGHSRVDSRSTHMSAAVAAVDVGIDLGLDVSILKSLPTFVYSKPAASPVLECAVCLSEFEDGEKGRVLPKCDHCFHNDCIDMWFHSHSNCPLCRAPVHLHIPGPPETVVPESIHGGSPSPRFPMNDDESPGSLSLLECPRKPLELVGITVDMPAAGGQGSE